MNKLVPTLKGFGIKGIMLFLVFFTTQAFAADKLIIGGKGPGDGVIFNIDGSGHGLEAKAADEATALNWTAAIAAASAYGSGWHLPSKNELNLLYQQKTAVGGFANGSYWSATDIDSNNAWEQFFVDGAEDSSSKASPLRVRAVRAF